MIIPEAQSLGLGRQVHRDLGVGAAYLYTLPPLPRRGGKGRLTSERSFFSEGTCGGLILESSEKLRMIFMGLPISLELRAGIHCFRQGVTRGGTFRCRKGSNALYPGLFSPKSSRMRYVLIVLLSCIGSNSAAIFVHRGCAGPVSRAACRKRGPRELRRPAWLAPPRHRRTLHYTRTGTAGGSELVLRRL